MRIFNFFILIKFILIYFKRYLKHLLFQVQKYNVISTICNIEKEIWIISSQFVQLHILITFINLDKKPELLNVYVYAYILHITIFDYQYAFTLNFQHFKQSINEAITIFNFVTPTLLLTVCSDKRLRNSFIWFLE